MRRRNWRMCNRRNRRMCNSVIDADIIGLYVVGFRALASPLASDVLY